MLLRTLVDTSHAVAATRSRKAKIAALADLLATLDPDESEVAVSFLSGEPRQARLGVGYAGLGGVEAAPADTATLELLEVESVFAALESATGPGSQETKRQALVDLFARATHEEQDFLRRLILRNLRQGALDGIMVEALAVAKGLAIDEVRRAVMLGGGVREVAAAILREGAPALDRFTLTVFRPVLPMLAQTAAGVAEALAVVGTARIERKLDGARVQVHRMGGDVRVYTRNLRDVTSAVPEIVELALRPSVDSIILDGESLAVTDDGRPHAFQETMGRFARQETGRLAVVFFDCLQLDGHDLIDDPAAVRFEAMRGVLPAELVVPSIVTSDAARAAAFFEETIAAGHEGVMVKSLDGPYEAGRRGAAWLKVKPVHTLDLVVLAVEWGSGRRRGKLSNLHLGARDPGTGEFVMLGKTFKGLTDEMLEWQTERFLELETHREGHVVYVRPEQVVEIALDGVQRSSRYPGGMALRFARVKGYRDDKTADEADTIDTVAAIHRGELGPSVPG